MLRKPSQEECFSLRIEVAFTPALLVQAQGKVAVVIDVLRATSSLVTLFARGLEKAVVVESIETARAEAARRPGWLLCGEEGGLPPHGFDYGNSPAEFDAPTFTGKRAVIATTNGTSAIARASTCNDVLIGSMLNLGSAAAAAVESASSTGMEIAVVCAGNSRGRRFSLEDAFCAGALVEAVLARDPSVKPWSSATAALRLYRSYGGSALAAFRDGDHAAGLIAMGFQNDVELCAERDRFDVVPRLAAGEEGTLLLRHR